MPKEIKVECKCHEEEDTPEDYELLDAHDEFARENKATFLNFGWATGDDFIHSKTNKGKIFTSRNNKGVITSEFTK